MIAISSHKPHRLSPEYAQNQMAAARSWCGVFDDIYYFGEEEPELRGPRTLFNRTQDFPWIGELMAWAGAQRQLVAIVNADIVVNPKLRTVGCQMEQKQIQAATSKRWHVRVQQIAIPVEGSAPGVEITELPDEPKLTDKGLDIFIARPWLWRTLAKQCPAGYRIGHCEWDTWCLGMLMRLTHRKMADFTESKCIFHPVHEGRQRPHNGEVPKMPEWLYDYAKMPLIKIRV